MLLLYIRHDPCCPQHANAPPVAGYYRRSPRRFVSCLTSRMSHPPSFQSPHSPASPSRSGIAPFSAASTSIKTESNAHASALAPDLKWFTKQEIDRHNAHQSLSGTKLVDDMANALAIRSRYPYRIRRRDVCVLRGRRILRCRISLLLSVMAQSIITWPLRCRLPSIPFSYSHILPGSYCEESVTSSSGFRVWTSDCGYCC